MSNWGGNTGFGYYDAGDDEDHDEEEAGFEWQKAGKDSLIFLIDCSEPMFEKSDDKSHFEMSIECAKTVLSNKIISSEKDLVGVVFFGTEKDKNSGSFKHIYVLQDLDQPSASRILELESFLSEGNNDFANKYGFESGYSLSDALWTCSNMFSQSPQKVGYKRVLLFTDNDDPHKGNVAFQRQAKQKAKDLYDIGIEIELMHMTQPDTKFGFSEFYQDIVHTGEDEEGIIPDASEKFDQLLARVRAKDHKKRTMGRIPFSLGKGLELGVGIYNLVRQQNRPYPIKLHRQTNEALKGKSKMYCEDTGELLMPSDIKKYQTYGGKNIIFEKDEVAEVKKFYDPGLLLMGFKPRSALKKYFHVRPAQFLFPDESSVSGSNTVFNALLQRCSARDVVAICRYIPRKNTSPKFVALLPQKEELDEYSVQIAPPGFHLIFLPFSDDIRTLEHPTNPRATPDQIDKAKKVVKSLQFKFSSENFENPVLQTHYRNLEALALDRDTADEMVDHTAPNNEMIEKRAGPAIREFMESVFPEGYDPTAKPAARKKAAGGTIDVADEARKGKLSKLTVAVLKEFCQKNGLSTAGKKNDLVETINDHLGL
ncbi:X-ray repair cross-complementing protein 6-like [Lytechinus variegatus]|uniref:X-ray repair cross-complementing protein 6-like n=1 Tax=Lytechinus variegatus TaxID=7654 RepID=UPI001BB23D65|nr:X-ray repair cross-complementing protein 6-like [Lytechinus variegatus]